MIIMQEEIEYLQSKIRETDQAHEQNLFFNAYPQSLACINGKTYYNLNCEINLNKIWNILDLLPPELKNELLAGSDANTSYYFANNAEKERYEHRKKQGFRNMRTATLRQALNAIFPDAGDINCQNHKLHDLTPCY